jgi:hypothetical protein
MGPAVLIPAVGGTAWHLFLGIATVVPRWMTGHRAVALGIYATAVICAWLINLRLPVDSFGDFRIIFLVPLVASVGLLVYFKFCKKA